VTCEAEIKVSPYITPPSRPSVHTRRLPLNEGRGHTCIEGILEAHAPGPVTSNHSHCVRVLLVEGLKCFGSMHIICRDPFIVLVAIALPLHQILEPPSEVASIEDLFDLILFFAFNHYWRRSRLSASGEGVFGSWCEFDHGEYGV
jgi:hypothetical protein